MICTEYALMFVTFLFLLCPFLLLCPFTYQTQQFTSHNLKHESQHYKQLTLCTQNTVDSRSGCVSQSTVVSVLSTVYIFWLCFLTAFIIFSVSASLWYLSQKCLTISINICNTLYRNPKCSWERYNGACWNTEHKHYANKQSKLTSLKLYKYNWKPKILL